MICYNKPAYSKNHYPLHFKYLNKFINHKKSFFEERFLIIIFLIISGLPNPYLYPVNQLYYGNPYPGNNPYSGNNPYPGNIPYSAGQFPPNLFGGHPSNLYGGLPAPIPLSSPNQGNNNKHEQVDRVIYGKNNNNEIYKIIKIFI